MSSTKGIHTAKNPSKRCGTCRYFLPSSSFKGTGICTEEEVCRRFQCVPIVITDEHEVCFRWEEEEQ